MIQKSKHELHSQETLIQSPNLSTIQMRVNTNEDDLSNIHNSIMANFKQNIDAVSTSERGFLATDQERLKNLLQIMR